MSLTQAQQQELLNKGLDKVRGEYTPDYAESSMLKEKLYNVQTIDSAFWEGLSTSGIGSMKPLSGALEYGEYSKGYGVRIEPRMFALGLEVERKFHMNNLYPVLKDHYGELKKSAHITKEEYAVRGYARLNSGAYDFTTWNEEGVPIVSTAHTTKNSSVNTALGGFSNLGTSAFSPTSVEATRILMKGFRNLNGRYAQVNPNGVIGPTTLDKIFEEVLTTPKGLGWAAGETVNVQAKKNWDYFTDQLFNDESTTNWMMVDWTLVKKMAKWLERMADETNATIDFETFSLKFSILSYFGYGFDDWRAFYMHQVG